ncbi:hypothetical protein [Salinirubrum litoreum]|uniref:DUF7847 domain-containing protein n=1 Tax=Salinirubrum litoreum TaxID=1126234 RepID=A0ABD5R9X6_9EURY|nr:hypothetical protein [Salinirubrum litoreum]
MAALRELRRAFGTLVSHPAVLVLAVALAVLRPPPALRYLYGPIYLVLAGLTFFVTPVVLVALLTRADDALRDREPSSLVAAVKDRYAGLLVGNLGFVGLQFGVNLAVGLFAALILVVLLVVGVGLGGLADGGAATATTTGTDSALPTALAGVTLVGYLLVLLFGLVGFGVNLLVDFALVFYKPAIVVADRDVGDAFRESYHLVRENLGTAGGFYVLRLAVGLLFGGIALALAVVVFSVGELGSLLETSRGGLVVLLAVVAVAYLSRSLTYAITLPYTVNVYQFLRYRDEQA